MTPAYRMMLKVSRTVHLYLTLFGLVLILFFAITGFMLNHENWFLPSEPRTRTANGTLPTECVQSADRFDVSEALRREFQVAGVVNSFRPDEDTIEVEFVRPGERTLASVKRENGETTVTFETSGIAGLMTDLHKGKSAGWGWALVIDSVCVLLLLISATGLVLWTSLRARGKWGAITVLLGTGVVSAVYFWLVP
jgi:uncharacterized protein